VFEWVGLNIISKSQINTKSKSIEINAIDKLLHLYKYILVKI
jgi:hypothetical protein